MSLYMAIVHYPCANRRGAIVNTSITNFDIHDMGRSARTYDVERVYLVNAVPSQQWFAKRVIRHWTHGAGADYNHTRKESMNLVEVADDLSQVNQIITESCGHPPVFIGTSAREYPNSISYADMRDKIEHEDGSWCLVFGTGWGLHPEIMEEMDYILEPIRGYSDYNHLSVRGAAAIILDRLRGR